MWEGGCLLGNNMLQVMRDEYYLKQWRDTVSSFSEGLGERNERLAKLEEEDQNLAHYSQSHSYFWNSNFPLSLVFKGQLTEIKKTLIKNKWWFSLNAEQHSASIVLRTSLGCGTIWINSIRKKLDQSLQSLSKETSLVRLTPFISPHLGKNKGDGVRNGSWARSLWQTKSLNRFWSFL